MKQKILYVVDMRHCQSDEPTLVITANYNKAVDLVHKFFLSYEFEIANKKPFDSGNEDGYEGGFDVFDSYKIYKGKISEFSHSGDDGPYAIIRKSKVV